MSRGLHEEWMAMLTSQIDGLQEERRILLDRLGALGLGGPLFAKETEAVTPEPEPGAEIVDPAKEIEELMRLRHRPTKLADALTRKAYQDWNRAAVPKVAWIPKVNAELDHIEEEGRKQATS